MEGTSDDGGLLEEMCDFNNVRLDRCILCCCMRWVSVL